ncbi:MAG TPA: hypothetical protein VGD14_16605 [bacterium]
MNYFVQLRSQKSRIFNRQTDSIPTSRDGISLIESVTCLFKDVVLL